MNQEEYEIYVRDSLIKKEDIYRLYETDLLAVPVNDWTVHLLRMQAIRNIKDANSEQEALDLLEASALEQEKFFRN